MIFKRNENILQNMTTFSWRIKDQRENLSYYARKQSNWTERACPNNPKPKNKHPPCKKGLSLCNLSGPYSPSTPHQSKFLSSFFSIFANYKEEYKEKTRGVSLFSIKARGPKHEGSLAINYLC
uniref:Putative ovule protein n=1 Tax=Solanum chacoense TaxID=4108 RepID=A0A0V0IGA5_SOLCH